MPKWKRDCHLITNKTVWKKEDGMTLIELMASLAILSVVIILVGSVHIFGQRQFINQTESASQANDLTYALSVMSRDLRKAESSSVVVNETNNEITILNGPSFRFNQVSSSLMKNSEVLSNKIKSVDFTPSYENELIKSITITLSGKGNQQNYSNQYQTTIYFRR